MKNYNDEKYLNFTKKFINEESEYNKCKRFGKIGALIGLLGVFTVLASLFLAPFTIPFYSCLFSGLMLTVTGLTFETYFFNKARRIIKKCGLNAEEFKNYKNSEEFLNLKAKFKTEQNIPYYNYEKENNKTQIKQQVLKKETKQKNEENVLIK